MEKQKWLDEHLSGGEADRTELLNVAEMQEALYLVLASVREDRCLDDLAEPVRGLIAILKERQRLALKIAEQQDAQKHQFKN